MNTDEHRLKTRESVSICVHPWLKQGSSAACEAAGMVQRLRRMVRE
jgi:hypothetical protein